tara:strand:- start:357 stop:755 length:399 start_codon:yes stop_codon:yes gene_type:complete
MLSEDDREFIYGNMLFAQKEVATATRDLISKISRKEVDTPLEHAFKVLATPRYNTNHRDMVRALSVLSDLLHEFNEAIGILILTPEKMGFAIDSVGKYLDVNRAALHEAYLSSPKNIGTVNATVESARCRCL